MNSSNAPVAHKKKFSVEINTEKYQQLITNTLGDPKRAQRFISSLSSAVATTPALQECTTATLVSGALLGESLGLAPSPQLGQFYLVPFKQKEKKDFATGKVISPAQTNATFILGYKGLLQLAIRSGEFKKFNALPIKEGEFKSYNPLTETIDVELIEDFDARESAPTIGYYAFFELTNGFRKTMYWTKKQMLNHADHYSKAFSKDAYEKIQRGEVADRDMWKFSSYWYTDFDGMAIKTMYRQLLSKGGAPLSIDIIDAIDRDNSVVKMDNGSLVSTSTDDIEAEFNEAEETAAPDAQSPEINLSELE